jgi:nitrogen fixation/metabolism regulation signal transduction histidine kinase
MKLEGKLPPAEAQIVARSTNTIVNQVASLKQMVDDFREYARTPPAQMQPIDLNALLTELLGLYGWDPNDHSPGAPTAATAAHFSAQLEPDLPHIEGDPAQLRQVIHNLLANARDAACQHHPSGDAQIQVQTRLIRPEDEPDRASVRLSVSDNGPGFAAEVLPRVFEPYVTTKATGTGLGLAIVKKIVEEHGAQVDISNRADGGARISILFTRLSDRLNRLDEGGQAQDNRHNIKV